MMLLTCAVVGVGSVVSIDIEDWKTVASLKAKLWEQIKAKFVSSERFRSAIASDLELFLARTAKNEWLLSDSEDAQELQKGNKIEDVTSKRKELDGATGLQKVLTGMPTPRANQIHVLVVVPVPGVILSKRTREAVWFAKVNSPKKERKLDIEAGEEKVDATASEEKVGTEAGEEKVDTAASEENLNDVIGYFQMNEFPPMADMAPQHATIMERDAYTVIFHQLMEVTKNTFEAKNRANVVITGNSGIGKSRFYLHVIRQLILQQDPQVPKFPAFKLVINFDDRYHIYDADHKSFAELPDQSVKDLTSDKNVLRLVDGKSSRPEGWRGVSILFATPDAPGMKDFKKVCEHTYIMPVWGWEELVDYNSLLNEQQKLSEAELLARYDKFGGIPRFIFATSISLAEAEQDSAINSFSAAEVISYVKSGLPVQEENYSDCILQMVPTRPDFLLEYDLDFLSSSIAETFAAKANEQELQELSALRSGARL